MVLGTVGYMSPEQAKGELADHRSDIFSFGAVLYEMLSGQRAFQGNSPVETLSAILKEQPPDLTLVVPGPVAGARPHRRSLPGEEPRRSLPDGGRSALRARGHLRRVDPGRGRGAAAAAAVAMGGGGGGAGAGRRRRLRAGRAPAARRPAAVPPAHLPARDGAGRAVHRRRADHRLRARRGRAVPTELFSTRPDAPEARPLQMTNTGIFAMSAKGEMAVVLGPRGFGRSRARSRAHRWPAACRVSSPRACWRPTGVPDGSELAIVRSGNGKDVLEYPIGKTLYDPEPRPHHPHPRLALGRRGGGDLASGVGRHRRRDRARDPGRTGAHAVDRAGTACSGWPGPRAATRSGSPARAAARPRPSTR